MLRFVLLFLLAMSVVSQVLARSIEFKQGEFNEISGVLHGLEDLSVVSHTNVEQVRM